MISLEYKKGLKIAEKNGIKARLYWKRIHELGWDPKRAASEPIRTPRKDQKWIKIAKMNGIGRSTYITRVDREFWDPQEAATTPVMTKEETLQRAMEQNALYTKTTQERINKDPHNLFKITPMHIEIAKENGIKKDTVRKRVYVYGWTVQDAITIPSAAKESKEKSRDFYLYLEIAKQNNIHPTTFDSRLKRGWSLEEAATKEIQNSNKGTRWSKNKEWLDLAIQNGIKRRTFEARVNRGWTCEEAATTPTLTSGKFLNEQSQERAREGFKKFMRKK